MVRDTKNKQPINKRYDKELLEDLCIALRNVGVFDYDLIYKDTYELEHIEEVKKIHNELMLRNIDLSPRIKKLSDETKWRMEELLSECLQYPEVLPLVKDEDGIRRRLRCSLCNKGEYRVDDQKFLVCKQCLTEIKNAILSKKPIENVLLFKTYNTEVWCEHSDCDTLLAMLMDKEYSEVWSEAFCIQCIEEELIK
ncbi:hypothetical protein [Litchfieldia salsa]|uniref:Uncharacterized protein n=1 Tax=Litchfieldia salsa TaxID=930152 RepID=A0A1H0UD00_9BACI|nr:hypothetical protein [Litchfieldia salsa]SDP64107.1 hypothetical protein SAMN05216565_104316 [Litchfieldia salsa]